MTIFGSICIHLFCGALYLWGNIATYVISYFHFTTDGHFGDPKATLKAAVAVIPIQQLMSKLFSPVGAFLHKSVHPKVLMIVGSAIMVGSVFISTYVNTWWMFFTFWAVLFPVGIGIVYWPPIICAWEWFPKNKGMISGAIIGAFGSGAFLFGFLTTALVNPENLKPIKPLYGGPPTMDSLFPIEVA